ncbi:hypothetical protein MASR2M29_00480 [Spirochaetota bacterium]
MYGTTFYGNSKKLENGAVINRGMKLKLVLDNESDSRLPVLLELTVKDAENRIVSSLLFTLDGEEGSIKVASITEDLPAFSLPEDLPFGYYIISSVTKDKNGNKISSSSLNVLNYDQSFNTAVLTAYPGNTTAEQTSLFKLEDNFPEGLDPWLRWRINGIEHKSGFVSENSDKIIWQAPKNGGLHTVRVEIYPFKPPAQTEIPPFAKAELKIPVAIAASNKNKQDSKIWAMFNFDGNFMDTGSRPDKNNIKISGEPYIDTWPTGFGYVFGAEESLSSGSSILPPLGDNKKMPPFSVSLSMAKLHSPSSQQDFTAGMSDILVINSDKGLLKIGIENDIPYFSFADESPVYAKAAVANYSQLTAFFNSNKLHFYIDNQAAGEGSLSPDFGSARFGEWTLSGRDGHKDIYDEFAVKLGAWPSFRLKEESRLGTALIGAYGFEGGQIDEGLILSGNIQASHELLSLGQGASLSLDAGPAFSSGFSVSLDLINGQASLELELNNGLKLDIGSNSVIKVGDKIYSNSAAGKAVKGHVSVKIEAGNDGLIIKGFDEQTAYLPKEITIASGRITIANSDTEKLELGRLLLASLQGSSSLQKK